MPSSRSARSLRVEAERYGVQVSALCPGVIRTPILTGGDTDGSTCALTSEDFLKSWEQLRPMAPDKFAERAIRAVLRNDAIIIVPAWWKVFVVPGATLARLGAANRETVLLKQLRELESTPSA